MRAILHAVEFLNEGIVDRRREKMSVSQVERFELITSPENRERFSELLQAFWRPIKGRYIGGFIARYVKGFVALPDEAPELGVYPLCPHFFLYRFYADITPQDLCYCAFRRAVFLRQNAIKVRRNWCSKRMIVSRTNDYVMNSALGQSIPSLYEEEKAEQVGAGDAEEAV